MKYPILIVMATVVLLSGCGDGGEQFKKDADKLRSENIGLRADLDVANGKLKLLESENFTLKQTPLVMLGSVRELIVANDENKAQEALDQLIARHPDSSEVVTGRKLLADAVKERESREKEKARIASLGFKAIPVKNSFAGNSSTVNLQSAQLGGTWKFNDHGDSYEYRTADRGSKYVIAQVVYSSRENSPKLLPLAVYSTVGGKLKKLGVMGFEFVSWQSFATFLGNYHDGGNDFANSERIRFAMGLQIKNEDISKPLYIVGGKTGCAERSEDRFGNPPVNYSIYSCESFPQELTVEDFTKGELGIVKRFD